MHSDNRLVIITYIRNYFTLLYFGLTYIKYEIIPFWYNITKRTTSFRLTEWNPTIHTPENHKKYQHLLSEIYAHSRIECQRNVITIGRADLTTTPASVLTQDTYMQISPAIYKKQYNMKQTWQFEPLVLFLRDGCRSPSSLSFVSAELCTDCCVSGTSQILCNQNK